MEKLPDKIDEIIDAEFKEVKDPVDVQKKLLELEYRIKRLEAHVFGIDLGKYGV